MNFYTSNITELIGFGTWSLVRITVQDETIEVTQILKRSNYDATYRIWSLHCVSPGSYQPKRYAFDSLTLEYNIVTNVQLLVKHNSKWM